MLWFDVGPAANSTASFAGYLDGEMDSKGICFLPLVGTACLRISGLVPGALCRLPPACLCSCSTLGTPSVALSSPIFLFQVPAIEENLLDDRHLLKPWDAKKVRVPTPPLPMAGLSGASPEHCRHFSHSSFSPQLSSSSSRPRSCEVPGIK